MFVIDYLKETDSNRIIVPPFHSGHLGLLPRSAPQTVTLLQSTNYQGGCELCITPYDKPLEHLFRLKCVLQERAGVVNRLLRAIAAMGVNVLSWESATLESKSGHGVFMLLDWSTTNTPNRLPLPKNIENIFFPHLSGIIPPNDLRYLRLLRQILGQCADVLLWETDVNSDMAVPRLRLNEFEESRLAAARGRIHIYPASEHPVRLDSAGVAFELHPKVAAEARIATGRDEGGPLHYILLSDIESKTLRVFIPRRGREKRMIHVGFSHKNLPGALCAITEVVARSNLSIVSGLVRKMTNDRNILEVTLEHDLRELSVDKLTMDPETWSKEFLDLEGENAQRMLRYYAVVLEPPLYPRGRQPFSLPLYNEDVDIPDSLVVISSERAERDLEDMAKLISHNPDYQPRRWLTDLLFAPDWGPSGKPTVFLSYPRSGVSQIACIKKVLGDRFHFLELQSADVESITKGAIERIRRAHFFVGLWHHESQNNQELSPWMPFEYGVALSHSKPSVILVHKDIPARFVDRIDRDAARITYGDLVVEEEKLADLERRCESWLTMHRRLTV